MNHHLLKRVRSRALRRQHRESHANSPLCRHFRTANCFRNLANLVNLLFSRGGSGFVIVVILHHLNHLGGPAILVISVILLIQDYQDDRAPPRGATCAILPR